MARLFGVLSECEPGKATRCLRESVTIRSFTREGSRMASSNNPATPEMCALCFDTIISKFDRTKTPTEPSFLTSLSYPLFVTWTKGPSEELRGCIGCFNALPIRRGIPEYALTSALEDPRFPPIQPSEIPALHVGVSLLHDFEECSSWDDWEVGRHGVLMQSPVRATFLPEVAAEEHWDKETTIKHLLRKGGYYGRLTDSLLRQIKLQRYQSGKAHMSYAQYLDYKAKQATKALDN